MMPTSAGRRVHLFQGVVLGVVHIKVAGAVLRQLQAGPAVFAHQKGSVWAGAALVGLGLGPGNAQRGQQLGQCLDDGQGFVAHAAAQAPGLARAKV